MEPKEVALAFLRTVTANRVEEAYDKYVDMAGRHHNQYFPAGFVSLREGMRQAHVQFPNTKLEVHHTVREGDLVAVHSRVTMSPDRPSVQVVHLFRIRDGRIVEMWDVGQPIASDSPNQDGPF